MKFFKIKTKIFLIKEIKFRKILKNKFKSYKIYNRNIKI